MSATDIGTAEVTVVPEVSELVQFKRQVWTAALACKESEGWCDSGFNAAMEKLGLPEYPGDKPERPYRDYVGGRKRKPGAPLFGSAVCGDPTCTVCYRPSTEFAETEEEFQARKDAADAAYQQEVATYEERLAAWNAENSAEALIN